MDPFSITLGVVTLLGALIKTASTAKNTIGSLVDAPEELRSLAEEADQLRAVLENIIEAVQPNVDPDHRMSLATNAEFSLVPSANPPVRLAASSPLTAHIERARLDLEQLEHLIDELIITDSRGQFKFNRTGWLLRRKKAKKLQKSLLELKQQLTILLLTRTLSFLQTSYNQAGALALARYSTVTQLLSRVLQGQSYIFYQLSRTETPQLYSIRQMGRSVPAAFLGQSSTVFQDSFRSERTQVSSGFVESVELDDNDESETQRDHASAERGSGSQQRASPTDGPQEDIGLVGRCTCGTKQPSVVCTPMMLSNVTGRLSVGVTGVASHGSPCASPFCKKTSSWSWTVSYYFPSKLLARAIILKCVKKPMGDPSIGVHTRRTLPDHSSLLQAVERDDSDTLKTLFECRHNTPNDIEPMGFSALTCAINLDKVQACRFLLEAGADASLQDSFGNSAVDFAWLAAFENRLAPTTLTFLRNDSRFFLRDKDHPEFVDVVEKYQFSRIHRHVLGLLPTSELQGELAETIVAVVNQTDAQGKTALLWASRRGDETSVRLLLENGADPKITDTMRRSPLHMACRAKAVPVIKLLLKYGADAGARNFLDEMPAHYACYEEDSTRLLEPLVKKGIDVNVPSKFGRTLLDIVVQKDFSIATQYLLDCGALAARAELNDWQMRPLGRAIIYQAHRNVQVLLRKGCDEGFVDCQGQNVLHLVAQYGNLETIDCMRALRLGTEYADQRNKAGRTPLDVTKLRETEETFLHAFGALLGDIREADYPENYADALS